MIEDSYLVSVAKPSASHIYFIGRAPQIRTEIERILSALPLPIRIVREMVPQTGLEPVHPLDSRFLVPDTSAALA